MKRIKKLIESLTRRVKYDALGFHKNIAIVGNEKGSSQRLVDSLDDSFNIFSLYTCGFKETNDVYYHRPYTQNSFNESSELQTLLDEFGPKKIGFEAIILTNSINGPPIQNPDDENFFSTSNLKNLYSNISKDLIAIKLAQKHLKPKGTIISLYDINEFSTENSNTYSNISAMAKIHLKFLMSELENMNYENRFYTILLDSEDKIVNADKYYKEINRLIEKSVFNRTGIQHNAFVHVKEESDGKINYYYM